MVVEIKDRQSNDSSEVRRTRDNWPVDYVAAYRRDPGPYTIHNSFTIISEEPLELFNGWLVWQLMTDSLERRIAGGIQEILSLTARASGFGQAYPDQFQCLMLNEDVHKPDVCILSNARYEANVKGVGPNQIHLILMGSPELVIEIRSPSNRRAKERDKRKSYFESGALVIWDVVHEQGKIWVYTADSIEKGQEFSGDDEISCEQVLPGWKRKVSDLFNMNLTVEDVVGEVANQWRAEGELEATRKILLRQVSRRYEAEKARIPSDLEARLKRCNLDQLSELADNIATSNSLEEWLVNLPVA